MSYAGIGWVVWAHEENLPKELIFELHCKLTIARQKDLILTDLFKDLGSTELSFNLNFSRPAHPVLGSYFNLCIYAAFMF